MTKRLDGNEDWIRRGARRAPSKGALAAERASAGLGTSDDDDGGSSLFRAPSAPMDVWARQARKTPQAGKPARR